MTHDDLDRHLDEQLRTAFAPPPSDRLSELARAGMRAACSPWRAPLPLLLLGAAAACVLCFFLGQWSASRAAPLPHGGSTVTGERVSGKQLGAMWLAAYQDAVQRGFENCCGGGCGMGGFDLEHACERRFSARLQLAADDRVRLVGPYEGLSTGNSMALLAESKTLPVCLFVLPRAEDPKVELPPGEPLHLARREVGDLVLYAISAAPGEDALGRFLAP